ncbi:hypothetical protein VTN96DRAFT_6300 [Rasamsonia emersonii]
MPSVKHNPWSSSLHPIRASAQVPAFVAINILHAATGPMDDGSSPREAAEGCHAVDVASWRAEKDILALGNRMLLPSCHAGCCVPSLGLDACARLGFLASSPGQEAKPGQAQTGRDVVVDAADSGS